MNIEESVLKIKIKSLFNERSFSICTVRELGTLLGVNPEQHPNFKYLHALHCVNYREMDKELVDKLPEMVMECLSKKFDHETYTKALLAVSRGEVTPQPEIEDLPSQDFKKISFLRKR